MTRAVLERVEEAAWKDGEGHLTTYDFSRIYVRMVHKKALHWFKL